MLPSSNYRQWENGQLWQVNMKHDNISSIKWKLCCLHWRLHSNETEKQGRISLWFFLLKVTRLYGTIRQMNILSAEVGSLEAVNSCSRNVQTQFTVCSPKLTFSCFIWFYAGVSVGPMPQSFTISFEWPWKQKRTGLIYMPTIVLFILKSVEECFNKIQLKCTYSYYALLYIVPCCHCTAEPTSKYLRFR